jgi:hypothetical protein
MLGRYAACRRMGPHLAARAGVRTASVTDSDCLPALPGFLQVPCSLVVGSSCLSVPTRTRQESREPRREGRRDSGREGLSSPTLLVVVDNLLWALLAMVCSQAQTSARPIMRRRPGPRFRRTGPNRPTGASGRSGASGHQCTLLSLFSYLASLTALIVVTSGAQVPCVASLPAFCSECWAGGATPTGGTCCPQGL